MVAEPTNPSASRLSLETRMCSSFERNENGESKGQDSAQTIRLFEGETSSSLEFFKIKKYLFLETCKNAKTIFIF